MRISYKPGDTLFHQLDAYSKFIWSILMTLWLMSLRDITSVVLVNLLIFMVVYFGAHFSLIRYLKVVSLLSVGCLWLILFHGYFNPGEGIRLMDINLSYQGMQLGIAIGLRTFGLVASGLALSTTTSPINMVTMLVQVGIPYRIAHVIYLGIRFVYIFERDLQAINDVQTLRGVKNHKKRFSKSIVALLATQLRRVDETAIALETRAFGLYPTQTILEPVRLTMKGVLLLGITVIVIVGHSVLK